jgi:hypothetical protein
MVGPGHARVQTFESGPNPLFIAHPGLEFNVDSLHEGGLFSRLAVRIWPG